ncbi:Sucraseferredoxin-like protein [Lipomyces arxii]|uniref:Sucraseferredoxin-like protein n=1 Tax=Lipomyces arxii TaxID=56418 RepID=UPI0034CE6268
MGLLSRVKSAVVGREDESTTILPVVPEDGCDYVCDTCTSKFPASLKFEDTYLWGSVKPWKHHLLISTGKSDWAHGLRDEKESLSVELESWSPKVSGIGRVMVSNSSLAPPPGYFETSDRNERKSTFLVLPTMIEATGVQAKDATKIADTLASISRPTDAFPSELSGVSFTHRDHFAVILLCSHRTRDKRCGVSAPILKKELELHLREHDLLRDASDDRPGGVPIYYVSHVGGHKLGGNVIIYRNSGEGIWMGRVEPKHCKAIVEETVLHGRVYPHSLRGAFKSDW